MSTLLMLVALSVATAEPPPTLDKALPAGWLCAEAERGGDRPDRVCVDPTTQHVRTPRVVFAFDKATLKRRSYAMLRDVAQVLQRLPNITRVEVQGHYDDPYHYSRNLSRDRAQSVTRFLIDQGIPKARLDAKGYGGTLPLTVGRTPQERATNRRIALVIRQWEPPPPTCPSDCSGPCADRGLCTPFAGACLPRSDADCARSRACAERGACTNRTLQCGPASADAPKGGASR